MRLIFQALLGKLEKGTAIPEFAIKREEYLFVKALSVTICCDMNVWKKGLVC